MTKKIEKDIMVAVNYQEAFEKQLKLGERFAENIGPEEDTEDINELIVELSGILSGLRIIPLAISLTGQKLEGFRAIVGTPKNRISPRVSSCPKLL